MKTILFLIIPLTFPFVIFTQEINIIERDGIISTFHLDSLSENGKNEFYNYYIVEENSREFHDFYTIPPKSTKKQILGKFKSLSKEDFDILNKHLTGISQVYIDFMAQTEIRYKNSAGCMTSRIDSLEQVYLDSINIYANHIISQLTPDQKEKITKSAQVAKNKFLADKQRVLSSYEKESDLVPSVIKHHKSAFEVMEKYPCNTYNYMKISIRSELTFLQDLDLDNYYNIYIEFEDAISNTIYKNNCSQSTTFPRYNCTKENQWGIDRIKENAIQYLANEVLKESESESDAFDFKAINTQDSKSKISDFIKKEDVLSLGFTETMSGLVNTWTFLKDTDSRNWDYMLAINMVNTSRDKKDIQNLINHNQQLGALEIFEFKGIEIYQISESDQIGDKLSISTQIIFEYKDELFMFVIFKNDGLPEKGVVENLLDLII